MEGEIISSLGGVFLKVGLFLIVQALVYLILSNSSNLFSKTGPRSNSFKTMRTISIRRWAAALGDIPAAGEGEPSSSPSPKGFFRSFSRRDHDN
ncbi:hypothetical protein CASFOL_041063 [Castilleja foliolosa]|uniref:Uncharacterized protein n=1 Tax=Castilleja foliolosa TaxID=1961234 RepID=A0ABD3BDL5_9LAMI